MRRGGLGAARRAREREGRALVEGGERVRLGGPLGVAGGAREFEPRALSPLPRTRVRVRHQRRTRSTTLSLSFLTPLFSPCPLPPRLLRLPPALRRIHPRPNHPRPTFLPPPSPLLPPPSALPAPPARVSLASRAAPAFSRSPGTRPASIGPIGLRPPAIARRAHACTRGVDL